MPLFFSIVGLGIIVAIFQFPGVKGWIGELFVKLAVGKTKVNEQYVIHNLKLRIDTNKTSQIDHIVINRNGIFVIETKNYSGRIYGQESQQEWTQVLAYGKVKNRLYNPVKQNKSHLYHISNLLPEKLPLFSAVVFVKGNIRFIKANGVYTLAGLKRLLSTSTGIFLSPEQMNSAYEALIKANDATIKNREHVQNIQGMQEGLSQNICPRCGKNLVVRKGKNGDFWNRVGGNGGNGIFHFVRAWNMDVFPEVEVSAKALFPDVGNRDEYVPLDDIRPVVKAAGQ